ncbi:hypothetical protein HDV00_012836 [Rhizophlyctis rosea]|nr:hypothetical protein HDV00_012836 [Rhizophlyctis rosea]
MGAITSVLQTELSNLFVHSVRVGETEDEDRNRGYFDVVNNQVDEVCEQLKGVEELRGGFNAVGFSQVGVEPGGGGDGWELWNEGVSEWPGCKDRFDTQCALARSLLLRGAYVPWIQHRVVQAQYFKDAKNYEDYLAKNIFLPDINNELPEKNKTYTQNLLSLNKFVMIQFEEDDMVVPKESAHFGYWNEEGVVVPLREQPLYKEDWLGLKAMDEKGKLVFEEIPGRHMRIDFEYLKTEIIPKYLAGGKKKDWERNRDEESRLRVQGA